jgi:hypothetical protein
LLQGGGVGWVGPGDGRDLLAQSTVLTQQECC